MAEPSNPRSKPFEERTDSELASLADQGLQGQGDLVEMMRRLRTSVETLDSNILDLRVAIEKGQRVANRLAWVLIVLTIVIAVLTAVMVHPILVPELAQIFAATAAKTTIEVLNLLGILFESAGAILIVIWSIKGYGVASITQTWERKYTPRTLEDIKNSTLRDLGIIFLLTGFSIRISIWTVGLVSAGS